MTAENAEKVTKLMIEKDELEKSLKQLSYPHTSLDFSIQYEGTPLIIPLDRVHVKNLFTVIMEERVNLINKEIEKL